MGNSDPTQRIPSITVILNTLSINRNDNGGGNQMGCSLRTEERR